MSSLLRGSIFTGDLNLINFYFESYMKKEARQIFVNSVANCSLFARKLETILGQVLRYRSGVSSKSCRIY